jgi:uncharacterized membrane protein YhaH (DUF805 family)
MAFRVFEDPNQGANFVVAVVTLPICILVTLIRALVIIRSRRKMSLEDWFAFLALLPYLGWTIYGIIRKSPSDCPVFWSSLCAPFGSDTCCALVVVAIEGGTKRIFDITQFDPIVWRDTIIVSEGVELCQILYLTPACTDQ